MRPRPTASYLVAEIADYGIEERACGMAFGGMSDDAGGLENDQSVGILVAHVHRPRLWMAGRDHGAVE
jgi:hypothetical protein